MYCLEGVVLIIRQRVQNCFLGGGLAGGLAGGFVGSGQGYTLGQLLYGVHGVFDLFGLGGGKVAQLGEYAACVCNAAGVLLLFQGDLREYLPGPLAFQNDPLCQVVLKGFQAGRRQGQQQGQNLALA